MLKSCLGPSQFVLVALIIGSKLSVDMTSPNPGADRILLLEKKLLYL
jgi:hypothetical protein